mgnify:FL=1|jgi:hypothetical protein
MKDRRGTNMKTHPAVLESKLPTKKVYLPLEQVLAFRRAEKDYPGQPPRDVMTVGIVQYRHSGVYDCDAKEWTTPQVRRESMDAGGYYLVRFGEGKTAVICLNHWSEMIPLSNEIPVQNEGE